MKEWMVIGKMVGSHGVKGELKVKPLTDDPRRFEELDGIWTENKGIYKYHDISAVRYHKQQVLLTLLDITDRNASDLLVGHNLAVPRNDSVTLREDEFFIDDLIGMQVIDLNAREIGTVKDILTTTGTVDTVEIALKTKEKKIYVPFRKLYFKSWDFEKHTLLAEIPEDFFRL
ncbi:MAG: ribosome maturation factor RimM [Eubacteriaceae bacterium]|nr:ribosome maturation factor RimM [Eubacteriaceae bacterium]MDD4507894.1 ribosome maturation factor RimM [Eubacteriaceae bacterium]